MEDILRLKLTLSTVKSTSKLPILERQLQIAVRRLTDASRQTLDRAFAMLELPNDTKINQLYENQPAMRHHVAIEDLNVRIVFSHDRSQLN